MRAYLAILPMLALVGCNPSAVERATDTGPKLTSKADLMDFADHPEKWKGKTITLEVLHFNKPLRGYKGQSMPCTTNEANFRMSIDVPDSDDLPNIANASYYIATIECTEGNHKSGNKLVKAQRK